MKIIIFLLFVFCFNVYSQWQPDLRLTNKTGDSYISPNSQQCIAANGNNIHVVWYDSFIGNYLIFYKRSTDGGTTWRNDTNLILTNYEATSPSIALSGDYIHVAWVDRRTGNDEIYYKYSSNGGVNWTTEKRITDNYYSSEAPVVCANGNYVNIFWSDDRNNGYEIYYCRSTDAGVTWGAETRLTNFIGASSNSTVSAVGSTIHLAWDDSRNGYTEIYYNKSTDNGATWGTDTRLTNFAQNSWDAFISASGNGVHITWADYRDGNSEIYYKNSNDGGMTWGQDMKLTNNASNSFNPCVQASGNHVHLVWYDNLEGNYEIYYKSSSNMGASWSQDERLTNSSGESENPKITVSDAKIYTVWNDYRDANFEIYFKQNPIGNTIGVENINSEIPENFSLSQNYPNPFNPETKIKFAIPKEGNVMISVYDVSGRWVSELVNQNFNAGTFEVTWNASACSSGVYFYKLETEGFTETKRMVLVK